MQFCEWGMRSEAHIEIQMNFAYTALAWTIVLCRWHTVLTDMRDIDKFIMRIE